jgi:uncharacterized repeat protein (TIGR03803 family)
MSSSTVVFQRPVGKIFFVVALVGLAACASTRAFAQYTEGPLYAFTGETDGASPAASLILDASGNLYGTAVNGGDWTGSNCPGLNPPTGCGVVFELSAPVDGSSSETVLYTFTGASDGAYPQASLVFDSKGNLYGTTSNGGNLSGSACSALGGCGVVFQLTPPASGSGTWTETPIYTFSGGKDGAVPYSNLIFDSKGNLYGTTSGGGASGYGTVFELTPSGSSWTETVLYSFIGNDGTNKDGESPLGGVIFDSAGNLYGTTSYGGSNRGIVFELTPPSGGSGSWTETILYPFTGHSDGAYPYAGLALDANGNLYGTTVIGGNRTGFCKQTNGCGVVFELSPPSGGSTSWTETPIYTFTAGPDGGYPYAGVILDAKGNVYGTTAQGGNTTGANCSGSDGCGVVFELSPPGGAGSWTETSLYSFNGGSDGGFPYAPLIFDTAGNIYGTTSYAGDASGSNCTAVGGCGVAFELALKGGPVVRFTPNSLIFGGQVINTTSSPKTVTVSNTGADTLTIYSITASANFAVSSTTCGATLAVGKSCKVMVTFTPTQLGQITGTLTFTDSAANSPQNVPLSGIGVLPVTLSPTSAAYAKQTVGTTSNPKKFTLTNNQKSTLTGIVIATTGDFAVSSTTCGATLASKAKCSIYVTFTPTQTGTRTGQLSVSDSAPNSPQTASLTGTGK